MSFRRENLLLQKIKMQRRKALHLYLYGKRATLFFLILIYRMLT